VKHSGKQPTLRHNKAALCDTDDDTSILTLR